MFNTKRLIKSQIKQHEKTIQNNNSLILELVSAASELGCNSNNVAVSLMRNQNEALKRIIKNLKRKLRGSE